MISWFFWNGWPARRENSSWSSAIVRTPTHFLIDPQGRIVQHKIGDIDIKLLRARILTMLSKQNT